MALDSAFFPGSVTADEWTRWATLYNFQGSVGGAVTAAPGDRRVFIAAYRAAFGGKFATDDAQSEVTLPANASSNPRIDRIVLRADHNAGSLILTSRPGTPAANPKPPTLSTDITGVYEMSLARVTVGPGQGALAQADIVQESTPPQRGNWYITSINTAPDPTVWSGALIYYTAQKSLRVGTPDGYQELADARPTTWTPINTSSSWQDDIFYAKVGRWVTVRGRVRRVANASSSSFLATLPSGIRPGLAQDTVGWQNLDAGRRMHAVEIVPGGAITILAGEGGNIVGNVAVRFTASWPVTAPVVVQPFSEE